MKRKQLIDVFPEWATGSGIFAALQEFDVPWKDESISGSLDLEYFGNISGEKYCSPLINKIIAGDVLTTVEKTLIATAIFALNGVNWSKQWETQSFEYNPIENYSMVEEMTDDKTEIEYGKIHGKTGTETETPNTTETETPNTTETETPNITDTSESGVYGFNSVESVPSGDGTNTRTGTNTVTKTGTNTVTKTGTNTVTKTGSDTMTYNTNETDSGKDTHTRNYKLTRSGNIGVTTSQQMLESERALWLWNYFYSVVFPDVDRALTLKIY